MCLESGPPGFYTVLYEQMAECWDITNTQSRRRHFPSYMWVFVWVGNQSKVEKQVRAMMSETLEYFRNKWIKQTLTEININSNFLYPFKYFIKIYMYKMGS